MSAPAASALPWLTAAQKLLARVATSQGTVVGPERSQALFDAAYSQHARGVARAAVQQGGA